MAIFSLVASACMSTTMMRVFGASSAIAASAARNGHSLGSMKMRPTRLITPTRSPPSSSTRHAPRPGAPDG